MEFLSPYIIAAAAGWVVAQILKYIVQSIRGRSLKSVNQLYLSGSMPSAHSSTVTAVLIIVGFKDGFDSALFGLALVVAMVVMYDAMVVRRSSGEQGKALVEFMKEQKSKVPLPRVAKGHTPFEVLGGAAVGVIIGNIVAYATLWV